MELNTIDLEEDAQDVQFTKYSIDLVYSSYLASQFRVHQYTHFLMILKHEEDAWAQKVEKVMDLMPDYKPILGSMVVL
jgi:hypothetical protein